MAKDTFEFDAAVGSNLDYSIKWILKDNEVIQQSTWTVLSGAVEFSEGQVVDNVTSCFLHPTVVGTVVRVLNEIVTDNNPPRIDSRTIVLSVKRR